MAKTFWAVIKTQFEGIHCYPNAPDSVAFLRSPHRHLFHVTVKIEQFHTSRDLEYLQFLQWLREAWTKRIHWKDDASCEHMALVLGEMIQREFPGRELEVCVQEDGENGALVHFDKV